MKNLLLETNKPIICAGIPIWFIESIFYRCNLTYRSYPIIPILFIPAEHSHWNDCTLTSIYDIHLSIDNILWRQGYLYEMS